jgi:hypothetical protein
MTTAHVANGSLILALAVTVALNAAIALPATTLPPINEKQTSTKAKAARTPPFRLEVAR